MIHKVILLDANAGNEGCRCVCGGAVGKLVALVKSYFFRRDSWRYVSVPKFPALDE